MKVSSSKFTFSLIAIAALFVSGSGLMAQDAYAALMHQNSLVSTSTQQQLIVLLTNQLTEH